MAAEVAESAELTRSAARTRSIVVQLTFMIFNLTASNREPERSALIPRLPRPSQLALRCSLNCAMTQLAYDQDIPKHS